MKRFIIIISFVILLSTFINAQDPTLTLNLNNPPVIENCPESLIVYYAHRYPAYKMEASDADNDELTWFLPYEYLHELTKFDPVSGDLTIYEPIQYYTFDFAILVGVIDNIDTTYCEIDYKITKRVKERFSILYVDGQYNDPDRYPPVFPGQEVDISISALTSNEYTLKKIDLLIIYDKEILSPIKVDFIDSYLCAWDEVSYRLEEINPENPSDTKGLIRLIGIPDSTCDHSYNYIVIKFVVTNNCDIECKFTPIDFFWKTCQDNVIYTENDSSNNLIYVSDFIQNYEELFQNYVTDLSDSTVGYPTTKGAQELSSCNLNEPETYARSLIFFNGGIFFTCATDMCMRGDINLDGLFYTVNDAKVFINYFKYGDEALYINGDPNTFDAVVNQTDINADGLVLSIPDLVYLIRIIIGDALPYPKISTHPISTTVANNNGTISVSNEMGAVYIEAEGNTTPELLAENMTLEYAYDNSTNSTRIIIYSMEADQTFKNDFVYINSKIKSIELSTYDGQTVKINSLPNDYMLDQNYPNPFNPVTTISFSLPKASDITLIIYNITGQQVKEFTGYYESGNHSIEWDATNISSGIYFYKITAGSFTDVKKMTLLK